MNFYTMKHSDNPDYCAIYDIPREMEQSYRSSTGMRVGALHDSGISLRMAREVSGKKVPDLINQVIGQFVVSHRAADIFKGVVNTEVEYLPISLLNHRKKVAANDLVILNVIGYYDCLDRTRTEGYPAYDLTGPEQVTAKKNGLPRREEEVNDSDFEYVKITRLLLHPQRTPSDANLFRLRSHIRTLIFREDVVDRLQQAKVTGAAFVPIGQPVEI